MFFSKSTVKPAQTIIKNHGPIHDSNEDILRIIKLYNQGSMRHMNHEPPPDTKYPYLLKYRASNSYIIFTVAFGILTSIYADYSLTLIASYIIDHQIKNDRIATQILSDEFVSYAMSSLYLFGHLGGLILFGWLGSQVKQRKIILITGTITSLIASGAFMASIEYWMIFPAKFLQGLSNACIWSMSPSLVIDIWPTSKLGTMVGFFCGLFPLGMTLGLTVGAIFQYVDHRCSFYCALALSSISFFMQLILIEKSTLPPNWIIDLEPRHSATQNETQLEGPNIKNNQHCTLDVMEEGGMWSKSSSMTTINLKDQPVIFEKEGESIYKHGGYSKKFQDYIIYRMITSFQLVSLLYQILIISLVIGALEPALSEKLLLDLNITNSTYRGVITSTFLFPCVLTAFTSGWLCDQFGSKIVGLTCIIISIPAFIWTGVPNQNVQSIVSSLALGGITITGTSVSILVVTTNLLQKMLDTDSADEKDTTHSHLTSAIIIFGVIGSISGIGYFIGSLLSKLYKLIGFFWLCFLLAMLLVTCIPFILYHTRSKKIIKSNSGLSQNSTGKKSIINNTRPESFAESMYMSDSDEDEDEDDDNATTIGSLSARSVCCETMERKSSVIVIP